METGQQQTTRRSLAQPPSVTRSAGHSRSASARREGVGERRRSSGDTVLRRLIAGGSEGNERLTTVTGVILIVLLAMIGVTLLRLRTTLLSVHLFVGLLLIGPVLVKLASTGYRFVRYYTHNPRYRRKGPPPAYLRMIAPMVVLSTIVVFASGVALLLIGPSSRGALLPVHKVSFIVWVAFTGVHVLGHLPEVQRTLSGGRELRGAVLAGAGKPARDSESHDLRAGRAGRALSLATGLVLGLALALALIPEFGSWLRYHRVFFGH
ncbi:MAG: hypothetical protein ACRDLF_12865 [Solirubrobacteraceae bacterium]